MGIFNKDKENSSSSNSDSGQKDKKDSNEEIKSKSKVEEILRVHCPACQKENDNPGKAKKIECSRCSLVINVKEHGKKIYGTIIA